MRSYRINMNRLVNQLIPHYIGGRRIILFLQSCLQPLQTLNEKWQEWANNMRLEAVMTSQIILLEYYLNHKFNKYFQDRTQRISISDGVINGVLIRWENSEAPGEDLVLCYASESTESNVVFRYQGEEQVNGDVSFIVNCPAINTKLISQQEMTGMLAYNIKKYCIAGKKFKIIHEQQ